MARFLDSDAVWHRMLSNIKDYAIFLLDVDGNIAVWNEGAFAMKGYTAKEAVGMHFSRFYTPEARAVGHPERELAVAMSTGRYEEQGWRIRKDGSRFWAHVIITPVFDDDQLLCGFGKILRDITAQKQALEESVNIMRLLEYTARTDYLTGLDNRRSLDMSLSSALSAARRHNRPVSLAMIDFDRFKDYNDEFGHLAGDGYLKKAANHWRQILRPEDFLARYGGEEFVVILPDTPRDSAAACMERLRAATPVPLTCSVGLAEWDRAETPSGLVGRADLAVYRAKTAGRDCLVLSDTPAATPDVSAHAGSRGTSNTRPKPRGFGKPCAAKLPAAAQR